MSSPLEGIPVPVLKQMLAKAQIALNDILTGNKASEVMTDGYLARFGRPDPNKLRAYIAELQAEIAGRGSVGAIGVLFG